MKWWPAATKLAENYNENVGVVVLEELAVPEQLQGYE
jgi:hypothetical protein